MCTFSVLSIDLSNKNKLYCPLTAAWQNQHGKEKREYDIINKNLKWTPKVGPDFAATYMNASPKKTWTGVCKLGTKALYLVVMCWSDRIVWLSLSSGSFIGWTVKKDLPCLLTGKTQLDINNTISMEAHNAISAVTVQTTTALTLWLLTSSEIWSQCSINLCRNGCLLMSVRVSGSLCSPSRK